MREVLAVERTPGVELPAECGENRDAKGCGIAISPTPLGDIRYQGAKEASAVSEMWWIFAGLAFVGAVLAVALLPILRMIRERRIQTARQVFRRRREWLEAEFFDRAASSGKPRGLRWTRCDFDDAIHYARHRTSREFCAFVGVTIGFEAVEGGGMEDVEAVGNLRDATAVFRLRGGQWIADGRVMFNLRPDEAIEYYGLEPEPRFAQIATRG